MVDCSRWARCGSVASPPEMIYKKTTKELDRVLHNTKDPLGITLTEGVIARYDG